MNHDVSIAFNAIQISGYTPGINNMKGGRRSADLAAQKIWVHNSGGSMMLSRLR